MATPLDFLALHLRDQKTLGKKRLFLSEESRIYLRNLSKKQLPKQTQEVTQISTPSHPKTTKTQAPATTKPSSSTPEGSFAKTITQANSIAQLQELLLSSFVLKENPNLRQTLVFSSGSTTANIAFIGEAPGEEEEKQQAPFVGPSGQLFEKILQAMQLSREAVYITNLVKYRPKTADSPHQGSNNRPPTTKELAFFRPYILRELELLQPKCIVTLGKSAYQGLFPENQQSLSQTRGKVHTLAPQNIPLVSTYHPSYLLRQQGTQAQQAKRQLWEDMLLALETAKLEITPRMRTYFQSTTK